VFRQLSPDAATAEALHRIFTELMMDAVSAGALPPRPGAGKTLAALHERGIKTCLMTGFERDAARPATTPRGPKHPATREGWEL
jgi:phosphoglycolate phosphatase